MADQEDVTIEFIGKHEHISERMKEHATDKIGRLARYQDRLTRIEVVADHVHENPEVEMIVHLRRGAPLVAKDRGTSFSATIDLLVDKAEALLRKQKEKLVDRQHAGPGSPAAESEVDRQPDEETYEDAVRKSLRD
ncbi:MAG: ribosome-associated translation inhibitor RaiA [Planctomycetes bacterium]|nr:ribosome-associated translation inhibitor RaiA [Planctomycetota bacterium]